MTDKHVESVRAKLLARSKTGESKYGTTLERTDLSRLQWLVHAQEEAMDLANYLEVLIAAETELINTPPKPTNKCVARFVPQIAACPIGAAFVISGRALTTVYRMIESMGRKDIIIVSAPTEIKYGRLKDISPTAVVIEESLTIALDSTLYKAVQECRDRIGK